MVVMVMVVVVVIVCAQIQPRTSTIPTIRLPAQVLQGAQVLQVAQVAQVTTTLLPRQCEVHRRLICMYVTHKLTMY
jgi:hypothetical protein